MKKEINNKEEQLKDFANSTGIVMNENTNKRKEVLVYDLTLVPEDMTMEQVIDKYKKDGILLYSSARVNNNIKPPYTITL